MKFRVHYTVDGENTSIDINADTPEEAAKTVRKRIEGAIVNKTKVVRDGK